MKLKKAFAILLSLTLVLGATACAQNETPKPPEKEIDYENASIIRLDGSKATLDGVAIEDFDYVWKVDTKTTHKDVKDCPAEYYEGEKPKTDASAYIAHDIKYYPMLDATKFTQVKYDGENEWVYYYDNPEYSNFIFATLPVRGTEVPKEMMHTEKEAYENPVLYITEPGTYVLTGTWKGQIAIDLGDKDKTFTDKDKKVTLVLSDVDVTCTVAPAFVCYSAYECDNAWEDAEKHSGVVDTSEAGITVLIQDGTVNNFTGSNVFRMLKAKTKSENDTSKVPVQKKARKLDGAFYSYVSMNIDGEKLNTGTLNITSTTFEGMGSELHLTVNGGSTTVKSQDDGVNVNEDHVSVFTMNGGNLYVYAGLGTEGDGIDSNGYITINGGTLVSVASPISDNGLDSDDGTVINGGTVAAFGSSRMGVAHLLYIDGVQYHNTQAAGNFGGGNFGGGGFNGDRPNGGKFNGANPPEIPNGQIPPADGNTNGLDGTTQPTVVPAN